MILSTRTVRIVKLLISVSIITLLSYALAYFIHMGIFVYGFPILSHIDFELGHSSSYEEIIHYAITAVKGIVFVLSLLFFSRWSKHTAGIAFFLTGLTVGIKFYSYTYNEDFFALPFVLAAIGIIVFKIASFREYSGKYIGKELQFIKLQKRRRFIGLFVSIIPITFNCFVLAIYYFTFSLGELITLSLFIVCISVLFAIIICVPIVALSNNTPKGYLAGNRTWEVTASDLIDDLINSFHS